MAAHVAGDRGAFAVLFERWAPRILRMLQRDLVRGEEAADLVQQTFLQLHRARADFRPGSRLRPWLYTIALNLGRQHLRRLGRRGDASLADPDAFAAAGRDPEAPLQDDELRALLATLPPAQREVIVLHWFEGLGFREIGEIVGATPTAVKVRAHRGYERLRAVLGTRGGVTDPKGGAYGD